MIASTAPRATSPARSPTSPEHGWRHRPSQPLHSRTTSSVLTTSTPASSRPSAGCTKPWPATPDDLASLPSDLERAWIAVGGAGWRWDNSEGAAAQTPSQSPLRVGPPLRWLDGQGEPVPRRPPAGSLLRTSRRSCHKGAIGASTVGCFGERPAFGPLVFAHAATSVSMNCWRCPQQESVFRRVSGFPPHASPRRARTVVWGAAPEWVLRPRPRPRRGPDRRHAIRARLVVHARPRSAPLRPDTLVGAITARCQTSAHPRFPVPTAGTAGRSWSPDPAPR